MLMGLAFTFVPTIKGAFRHAFDQPFMVESVLKLALQPYEEREYGIVAVRGTIACLATEPSSTDFKSLMALLQGVPNHEESSSPLDRIPF